MVTANRTWDGAVVYRTGEKDWSTAIMDGRHRAHIGRGARIARRGRRRRCRCDRRLYRAPVELDNGGKIKPGNLREQIRSEGVTIDISVPA